MNLGEGVHLLTRRSTTYEDWIRVNQRNIDYVRRKRSFRRTDGDPLESALSRGLSAVNSIAKQAKYGNVETPAHGDVCAQNVIMDEKTNGIHLIDWENFGLWDPAAEIALIFEGFGLEFRLRQQDEFLKYYGRKRKDDTLRERLDIFRPLVRFEQLTWGIKHVLEIRRGDMDKAFIERSNIKKHLDFVTSCLGKCSESHLIDISRKEATEIRSILVE